MPSSKGLSNNLRITPYYIDTLNYLKNKRNSVFYDFHCIFQKNLVYLRHCFEKCLTGLFISSKYLDPKEKLGLNIMCCYIK